MRGFVFLLILANLLFFAWTQGYLGTASSPDAFRMQQQLLANQVTVVARDVPPPETTQTDAAAKPVENKTTEACLALADLSSAVADHLETLVTDKFSGFKLTRTNATPSPSYWVNIPPLASKKDVDTKAGELKKLGLTDFFIVQESGPNNRAISLGLYSSKEAASAYLETLRGKGVKSAKITERQGKPALAQLEIRGPEAQFDTLRQAISEAQSEIKPGNCKTPAASAQ